MSHGIKLEFGTAGASRHRVSGLFWRHGQSIVIPLSGGSKRTQATDIKTAKAYWADWKRKAGMNEKAAAAVSHHDREVAELRTDRELAVE